jgi:hypothetical protein
MASLPSSAPSISGSRWQPVLATVGMAGVLGQAPGTNYPKEPTQPSRTLPQHNQWTRITCIHNKEEARGGEHCTMENGVRIFALHLVLPLCPRYSSRSGWLC